MSDGEVHKQFRRPAISLRMTPSFKNRMVGRANKGLPNADLNKSIFPVGKMHLV